VNRKITGRGAGGRWLARQGGKTPPKIERVYDTIEGGQKITPRISIYLIPLWFSP